MMKSLTKALGALAVVAAVALPMQTSQAFWGGGGPWWGYGWGGWGGNPWGYRYYPSWASGPYWRYPWWGPGWGGWGYPGWGVPLSSAPIVVVPIVIPTAPAEAKEPEKQAPEEVEGAQTPEVAPAQ
jgi:hypothetical protein